METSQTSHISLIDLSAQFPFDIDDAIKKELCFAETLIISCGHVDGEIESDSSDSESEGSTTVTTSSHEGVEKPPVEIKDFVEEPPAPVEEEEDDFHFYFFPDCKKPLAPQHSQDSLIIVDGMPKVNPAIKEKTNCTCNVDKRGKCECHANLPCMCGAKTTLECTCAQLKDVCICHDGEPMPVCLCRGSDVCLCHPDGKLRAVCTCDQVDKPCICHPEKYPSPVCTCDQSGKPCYCHQAEHPSRVCTCKHKKFHELKGISELPGEEYSEEYTEEVIRESIVGSSSSQPPCDCQKPDPTPQCFCLKEGRECICQGDVCICGVRNACVCEPTSSHSDISCTTGDSKSICACTQHCTCEDPKNCKCYHPPPTHCTCGDGENCKCFKSCTCEAPCTCVLAPPKPEECICSDKSPKRDPKNAVCTCEHTKGVELSRKMKKVRAGKEGYRWCHDVDPRHTYFDYAYGRHDKVDYKEQEKEKFKILGLNDDEAEVKAEEGVCPVHEVKAPPYEKKVRRPSIDCCSAVGGMSLSVETLGEDKDKFLVQVVSHSSKEGAKTGSKLIGILDSNLHTLEENRTEYIIKKDKTKERRSYLAICDSGYYNKITRIFGDRHVVKRLYHDFSTSRNFLLEAANVVLLRYIALRRYRGNIKTETIMMDGMICESIYACLGVSQAIVNNTPLFVVKVERHIIEPSGYIHQTLTVLTLRGYIISHEWANNSYICHLNPLLTIIPEKDEIETHAPLRERWREDLQLLSDYLNFKSCRSSEGARYVAENGALTGIIRDYLQAILMIRPHDTLHFTRHYFGSALSALDLPRDEYFDPASRHVRYFFFEQ